MPINFQLDAADMAVRDAAAAFAQTVLKPARAAYAGPAATGETASQQGRFQATRAAYAAAVAGGLVRGQLPPALGGTGGSLVQAALLVEECYAVEASASLTLFGTGLGLSPLTLRPDSARHAALLAPFLAAEGAPLASLVFSEPGGVANWLEPGAPGLNTTARRDGDGGDWILNGDKMWATNSAGWDGRGADLACVVCRDADADAAADPRDAVLILLVTRADLARSGPDALTVVRDVATAGHTAVSGPHIRYTNVRVPVTQVLCGPGGSGGPDGNKNAAADVVTAAFDASAVLVGAMGVGLMRAAFDAALAFARADARRGAVPLLARAPVADLLSGVKMAAEACRALTWKAAVVMERGPGDYAARRELALAAKVYCSEAAVKAVLDAINAVGITAYDTSQPFAELLNSAMVLPIFDGGNVGIRRRHMQELMLSPAYDAWAATYGPSTSA